MGIIVKTRNVGKMQAIAISGRIVNVDSEKFKKKLELFSAKNPGKTVVVDLSESDFIDSFGLGALVGHHTALQKQGRNLVILNTNPNKASYVRRLFEMTSLDTIFTIIDQEDKLPGA